MDIQKLVSDKVGQLVSDNTIEDLITKTVEDTIKSSIRSAFTGYGFRKAIDKKLETEIDNVLAKISLKSYNALFLERINIVINSVMNEDMVNKVNEYYKDIFMSTKQLELSKLFEMIRESFIDEDEDQYEQYFSLYFNCSEYGDYHIYFDKEADKEKYRCNNSLSISEDGTIYSLTLENIRYSNALSTLKIGYLETWERALLNCYFSKTPLIIDITSKDDVDTSLFEEY